MDWSSPLLQAILGSLSGIRVGPRWMIERGGGFRPLLPVALYAQNKALEQSTEPLEEYAKEGYIDPKYVKMLKISAMLSGQPLPYSVITGISDLVAKKKSGQQMLKFAIENSPYLKQYFGQQTPKLSLSYIPTATQPQIAFTPDLSKFGATPPQPQQTAPQPVKPTDITKMKKEDVKLTVPPPTKQEMAFNVATSMISGQLDEAGKIIMENPDLLGDVLKTLDAGAKFGMLKQMVDKIDAPAYMKEFMNMMIVADPNTAVKKLTEYYGSKEMEEAWQRVVDAIEKEQMPSTKDLATLEAYGVKPKEVYDYVAMKKALKIFSDPKTRTEWITGYVKDALGRSPVSIPKKKADEIIKRLVGQAEKLREINPNPLEWIKAVTTEIHNTIKELVEDAKIKYYEAKIAGGGRGGSGAVDLKTAIRNVKNNHALLADAIRNKLKKAGQGDRTTIKYAYTLSKDAPEVLNEILKKDGLTVEDFNRAINDPNNMVYKIFYGTDTGSLIGSGAQSDLKVPPSKPKAQVTE